MINAADPTKISKIDQSDSHQTGVTFTPYLPLNNCTLLGDTSTQNITNKTYTGLKLTDDKITLNSDKI